MLTPDPRPIESPQSSAPSEAPSPASPRRTLTAEVRARLAAVADAGALYLTALSAWEAGQALALGHLAPTPITT